MKSWTSTITYSVFDMGRDDFIKWEEIKEQAKEEA